MAEADRSATGVNRRQARISLLSTNFQTQHLARFAFNQDVERPAAHFAIGCKPLCRGAGVNDQVKALAAIRALDGFAGFHV